MGESREALRAGQKPKTIPVPAEKKKAPPLPMKPLFLKKLPDFKIKIIG